MREQARRLGIVAVFLAACAHVEPAPMLPPDVLYRNAVETAKPTDQGIRRDVRWITDRGELHEWYLGEWRREHLVKAPEDYRILSRALESSRYTATAEGALKRDAAAIDAGGSVTFRVTATGSPPLTYRWFKDGAALDGATLRLERMHVEQGILVVDTGGASDAPSATLIVEQLKRIGDDGSALLLLDRELGARKGGGGGSAGPAGADAT